VVIPGKVVWIPIALFATKTIVTANTIRTTFAVRRIGIPTMFGDNKTNGAAIAQAHQYPALRLANR
jgi:hypothetical protein